MQYYVCTGTQAPLLGHQVWDYKQLLDEVFVISRIIEVEVGIISLGLRLLFCSNIVVSCCAMCANVRNKSQHVGSLDENTKDSRRHVEFFVCSARALAQRCWMCCANERNIVGPRFDDPETIEMLALIGSEVWPVSNFIQQLPTSRNKTQQHTTWCANARNMLGPTMLRLVGQKCCERLHGPLVSQIPSLIIFFFTLNAKTWKSCVCYRTDSYFV